MKLLYDVFNKEYIIIKNCKKIHLTEKEVQAIISLFLETNNKNTNENNNDDDDDYEQILYSVGLSAI